MLVALTGVEEAEDDHSAQVEAEEADGVVAADEEDHDSQPVVLAVVEAEEEDQLSQPDDLAVVEAVVEADQLSQVEDLAVVEAVVEAVHEAQVEEAGVVEAVVEAVVDHVPQVESEATGPAAARPARAATATNEYILIDWVGLAFYSR